MHQPRRRIHWLLLLLLWAVPLEARPPVPQRLNVVLSHDDGYSALGLPAIAVAMQSDRAEATLSRRPQSSQSRDATGAEAERKT
jgi:hypothetical protein